MSDRENIRDVENSNFTAKETCTALIRPRDFSHLWIVCDFCDGMTYHKIAKEKFYICEYCDSYIKMKSSERIDFLLDSDTWKPMDQQMRSLDPIHFDSLDPLDFNSLDPLEDPIEDPIDFDSLDPLEDPIEDPIDFDSLDSLEDPIDFDSLEDPEDSDPEDSDPEDSDPEDSDPSDPKDSNPQDSDPSDPKDSNPQDSDPSDPKDSNPKDSDPSDPKDSNPKDSDPSDPKDSDPSYDEYDDYPSYEEYVEYVKDLKDKYLITKGEPHESNDYNLAYFCRDQYPSYSEYLNHLLNINIYLKAKAESSDLEDSDPLDPKDSNPQDSDPSYEEYVKYIKDLNKYLKAKAKFSKPDDYNLTSRNPDPSYGEYLEHVKDIKAKILLDPKDSNPQDSDPSYDEYRFYLEFLKILDYLNDQAQFSYPQNIVPSNEDYLIYLQYLKVKDEYLKLKALFSDLEDADPSDPKDSNPQDSDPSDPKDSNPQDSDPSDPKDSNPQDSNPEDSNPEDSNPEDSNPEDSDPEDSNPESSDPEDLSDKKAELEAAADSYYRNLGICIYVDKEEIPFHKASDLEYEGKGDPVVIDPEDDEIEVGVLVEGEIKKEDQEDTRRLLWLLSLFPELFPEKKEEEKNVKIEDEEENVKIEDEEENVKIEDEETYTDKMKRNERETGLSEAVETGTGKLNGIKIAMGVMDFRFVGGSMGSVVGEKITRLIEHATKEFLPLIIVCASGGARMQEGSLSLMQMAKISSALSKYRNQKNKSNKKLFYISILTTPTTGGVTASFAMLGDIIIAEPDAYIAFAGKRVIEELFNIEVPEGSQEAEVLFEKGFLDLIVPRNLLKSLLTELLQFHSFRFDPTLLSPKLIRRLFQNFVKK
uniref:Acetyl-coenzyme A carboxylase carboxyl transferase subunit beta, chloroplastic n=1 Tax=Hypericum petiolulatum TaxID=1137009 RepID=A0AAU7E324_9ROSI